MQVSLCGHKGSMARLQISDGIDCGNIIFHGQLFAFDNIVLHANSMGHLSQIENLPPGQIIRFGNLEYATDIRGKLAFSDWLSDRSEDTANIAALTPDSISGQGLGGTHASDVALSTDLRRMSTFTSDSWICLWRMMT